MSSWMWQVAFMNMKICFHESALLMTWCWNIKQNSYCEIAVCWKHTDPTDSLIVFRQHIQSVCYCLMKKRHDVETNTKLRRTVTTSSSSSTFFLLLTIPTVLFVYRIMRKPLKSLLLVMFLLPLLLFSHSSSPFFSHQHPPQPPPSHPHNFPCYWKLERTKPKRLVRSVQKYVLLCITQDRQNSFG